MFIVRPVARHTSICNPLPKLFHHPALFAGSRNIAKMSTAPSTTPAKEKLHVLLLGVHMNPGEPFSESALIDMIESDVERGRARGLEIEYQLVHSGEPEYGVVAARLREKKWDVVAVGPGVRFPRERSALFEGLVNAVVGIVRPVPLIVFNTKPDGVVEAWERAKGEMERVGKMGGGEGGE